VFSKRRPTRSASFVVALLASGSNINIQWQGERQASYPLEMDKEHSRFVKRG
jgi:hypothetical protein